MSVDLCWDIRLPRDWICIFSLIISTPCLLCYHFIIIFFCPYILYLCFSAPVILVFGAHTNLSLLCILALYLTPTLPSPIDQDNIQFGEKKAISLLSVTLSLVMSHEVWSLDVIQHNLAVQTSEWGQLEDHYVPMCFINSCWTRSLAICITLNFFRLWLALDKTSSVTQNRQSPSIKNQSLALWC
jgi:hypothetical protein